jgi:hypothetical protein
VALILARPIDAFGEVPVEELAREAPALCEQLLRALASDDELEGLLAGPQGGPGAQALPQRLAALSAADGPAALVGAVEALRGAIWELLLELLAPASSQPSGARLLGDLSDRLASICSALLAAAVAQAEQGEVGDGARRDRAVASAPGEPGAAQVQADSYGRPRPFDEGPGTSRERPGPSVAPAGQLGSGRAREPGIVIVDERRAAYASIERPPFRERVASAEMPTGAEIEARDERGDEGPAAWIGSIGRQLERHERDRQPFTVVLMEVRVEHPGGRALSYEALEDALVAELHEGGGSLTRERAGRYWLLSPHTDRVGAQGLTARLTQLTGAVASRQGASVTLALGTAVCPEDGVQASELAAHADIGLYASRSEIGLGARRAGRGADEPA